MLIFIAGENLYAISTPSSCGLIHGPPVPEIVTMNEIETVTVTDIVIVTGKEKENVNDPVASHHPELRSVY